MNKTTMRNIGAAKQVSKSTLSQRVDERKQSTQPDELVKALSSPWSLANLRPLLNRDFARFDLIYPVVDSKHIDVGKKNYFAMKEQWMKNFREAQRSSQKRDSSTQMHGGSALKSGNQQLSRNMSEKDTTKRIASQVEMIVDPKSTLRQSPLGIVPRKIGENTE